MPSRPITDEQFKRLIEITAKEKNKFIAMRDILMYFLDVLLGFRPSESRLIELTHIDFTEKTIFIPAENNKERQADDVYVPDFIIRLIRYYLSKRKIKSKWLFPSSKNNLIPICYKQCQRNFTNRLKRAGMLNLSFYDKSGKPRYNLNLYSFRKKFGTFVYKKSNRCPQTTALMLRHRDKKLSSVWSYVFAVEKENRKEIMESLYENPI